MTLMTIYQISHKNTVIVLMNGVILSEPALNSQTMNF